MINTLLISKEPASLQTLTSHLTAYCPQVDISGIAASREEVLQLLEKIHPDLIFIDQEVVSSAGACILEQDSVEFEMIILHSTLNVRTGSMAFKADNYLFHPIKAAELLAVVARAQHRIGLKKEWLKCRQLLSQLNCLLPPNDLIGIPTMEGMEFLKAKEIIRCEGLQQFTRVVVSEGPGIISSYNIGKFCELLCPYGFFAPHKSHLINLQHIRKYMQEGTVLMRDGSTVPVSRRRKGLFLDRVKHL